MNSNEDCDSTTEDKGKNDGKSNSPLPRFLPGTSRYGRTIKPKSPTNVVFDSPKNLKMSKNVKLESSTIEDESRMEDLSIVEDSVNNSLDGSIKMEEHSKLDVEDIQSKCPWTLGQLVWARIGSFPFWPGVVTLDPTTMTYVRQRIHPKNKHLVVHVRYCADRGRHSWVALTSIIPFKGLVDFEKRSREITPDLKKREPKYVAALIIKPAIKLKWDDAVSEASRLMAKSIETRIELFRPKGKNRKSPNSAEKSDEGNKKRKNSAEESLLPKKSKSNFKETEEPEERIVNKSSIGNNVNLETPPTPPSSNKDSSDEAPIARRFNIHKRRSGKEGVFEIFCERNKELAEQLDPEASEADIKAYLLDLWENMASQDRSKYRADYLQDDEMRLYALNIDEDEEDVDSEPEPEKPVRRRRTKTEAELNELSDRRKSKTAFNRSKDEPSDQEETTSVESEVIVKSVRRHRKKARRGSSDQDDVACLEEVNGKPVKKRKLNIEKDDDSDNFEPDPLPFDYTKRSRYKLFKGLKNERVCQICEETGNLIRCKGPCYSYFHLNCVKPDESSPEPSEAGDIEENEAYKEDLKEIKEKVKQKEEEMFDDENFKCIDCLSGVAPACFVCQQRDGERTKCSVLACGKHYHTACLKGWPQCQWQGDRLTCPYHVCHTCASDNPQNGHPRCINEKFARCVRCPSTYHASASCLPAGSNILTGNQIVCTKHYKSTYPPVNATWCFLCTEGGTLICCDTCPTSFHLECLSIDAPAGGFICEDCETGRLPLYGEIVWVKLGNYRWWPSIICYPQEIPVNIAAKPHKTGQFCVMFLGTRDYYWIHRGKAFLFQEGDASTKVIGAKKFEESYRIALKEAKYFHERLMSERAVAKDKDNGSRNLRPPTYVKLKVNKPVGNVKVPEVDSMAACNCDPNSSNPCSPDADCLNRILLIECSPDACPAGTKCQNQMFVQRTYPAMKPYHTEERGWGLKSLEFIKEGQFIIEYVGEIIDEAEYKLRLQQKKERKNENYYFLTIDNCRMIDAEPKGNLSRFMNHSCQPNCETQKWTVNGDTRIGLFALRDIEPGEELTFNYNLACDGETKKPCLCKAPNCSGFIGLKVPKQSMNLAQQKKIEKAEKVKRGRKHRKVPICWNCNLKIDNLNESYSCDQKTCGKVYHPHCIAIEDGPDQVFHCPWHFCAECYKRTSIRCSYCCNAFCQEHVYGNLRERSDDRILICYNHPSEYADYADMDMDMGEALMDDDGEEDEFNITEEQRLTDISQNGVSQSIVSSSPKQASASPSDETSSRGAIVEVHASSEDGEEEDESPREGDDEDDHSRKDKSKRGRRKQSTVESDFTLDQIAAIIGIVK